MRGRWVSFCNIIHVTKMRNISLGEIQNSPILNQDHMIVSDFNQLSKKRIDSINSRHPKNIAKVLQIEACEAIK